MRDESAVSAVLSTVLMISVAVLLTIAVLIFAHILTKAPRDPPANIGMNFDEDHDRMQYVRSTEDRDLSELVLRLAVDGHYGFNEAASLATPAVGPDPGAALASSPGVRFAPGDTIQLCGDSASSAVTVTIADRDTTLLKHVFDFLQACA